MEVESEKIKLVTVNGVLSSFPSTKGLYFNKTKYQQDIPIGCLLSSNFHCNRKRCGKFAPEIRRVFRDLSDGNPPPMRRDLPRVALLITFTLVGLASAFRPSLLYLGPLEGGKTDVKRAAFRIFMGQLG